MIIDPKEIGVPNINFSLYCKDDDCSEKYKLQRIERGFDDSETWDLGTTFSKFMIPRLERYLEYSSKFIIIEDDFMKDINDILIALKLIIREDSIQIFTKTEKLQVKIGLQCLTDNFMNLWN